MIDLTLNNGPFPPDACLRLLNDPDWAATSLSSYATGSNQAIVNAIAATAGVDANHIMIGHGSGPIIQTLARHVVRSGVMSSPVRIARHLWNRSGYPVVTPDYTYGKVIDGARARGMRVETLPLEPHDGFRLNASLLNDTLRHRASAVYLCSPTNPTGQFPLTFDELAHVVAANPASTFVIDEAYLEFTDAQRSAASLTLQYPNVLVSHSFSFAYGLAGLRAGYVIADPAGIRKLAPPEESYMFGAYTEALLLAAISDREHLPRVRAYIAKARAQLVETLEMCDGVEAFPSLTNFVLCRFVDHRSGEWLAAEMRHRGIQLKTFSTGCGPNPASWFRVTVGLEDDVVCQALREVLGS